MKRMIALLLALTTAGTLAACQKPPALTNDATMQPDSMTQRPTEDVTEPPTVADGWVDISDTNGNVTCRRLYEQGILLEEIWLEDGVQIRRDLYRNDANGKPYWKVTLSLKGDGELEGYVCQALNSNGRILREVILEGGDMFEDFYVNGTEVYTICYSYDHNGEVLDKQEEAPLADQVSRKFYFYDDRDNLIAICDTVNGPEYEASYDEENRIIYESNICVPEWDSTDYVYNEDGTFSTHFVGATFGSADTQYDAQGRPTQTIFYADESVEYQTDYRYNDHSDVVEERYVSAIDNETTTTVYEYEYEQDRWVKKTAMTDGVAGAVWLRTYDADGRLLTESDSESVTTYRYNEQGQLTEKILSLADSSSRTYLYTYDEQGRLFQEILCEPSYEEG